MANKKQKMTSKDYQNDTGKIESTQYKDKSRLDYDAEADRGFGNYDEGVGGGQSPNGSAKPGTHGHGVNSDHRKQNNDTMQARTDDGKFTYKSVNGQSIDPKYGPSRGKTVNPLLTGGKNGVKIEDVERQFRNKSGEYWDEYGKTGKWFAKGAEREFLRKSDTAKTVTKKAAVSLWDLAKEYDMVKGEFVMSLSDDWQRKAAGKLMGNIGDNAFSESNLWDESKRGTKGKEEKAASQKAIKTGKSQMVTDIHSGGYKTSGAKPFKKKAKTVAQPAPAQPAPKPAASIPTQPAQQAQAAASGTVPAAKAQAKPYQKKQAGNPTSNQGQGQAQANQTQSYKDFSSDVGMAKSNPAAFANKYQREIDKIVKLVQTQMNPQFSRKAAIQAIANGKAKSIGDFERFISSYLAKKNGGGNGGQN